MKRWVFYWIDKDGEKRVTLSQRKRVIFGRVQMTQHYHKRYRETVSYTLSVNPLLKKKSIPSLYTGVTFYIVYHVFQITFFIYRVKGLVW